MKPSYLLLLFLICTSSFAQFNPIQLGSSSNIETITQTSQNQVYVDNQTNTVVFIHRQDVTLWGGSDGQFRYDISTDNGNTFNIDIGDLQPTNSKQGRHPQITVYNPNQSSNPLNTQFVFWGATLDPAFNFNGHVAGIGDVVTSGQPTNTENYLFNNQPTHITGGLCQGQPGEFWLIEADYDDIDFSGFITWTKGTYNMNTEDIDWEIPEAVNPGHDNAASPDILLPNIAFSPDGSVGWMAFGGDITGSTDGVYSPIFYRSLNGGDSWVGPFFLNFNNVTWIDDRLSQFGSGSGDYGMVHSFDLTVDANGNPHLLTVVGHISNFEVQEGAYSKLLVDVTSDNLGGSFKANYVAPVLNNWGLFGTPDNNGDLFETDNFCQISRSEDGQIIFYDWIDSVVEDGNGDYEYTGLIAPNLRASAYHVNDNTRTCIRKVTDLDFIWDGRALCPTVAPTVVEDNGQYKVPVVMVEMISNDQSQPCQFHYFGNEIVFGDGDFVAMGSYNPDDYLVADANACEVVLAIDLLSFSAKVKDHAVDLNWEVSGQINTNTFEIERRDDINKNFQTIGSVDIQASDHLKRHFNHQDVHIEADAVYYYRLKWKEEDGQIRYSSVESVYIKSQNTILLYPNPAHKNLFIKTFEPQKQPVEMTIFDINGRLVESYEWDSGLDRGIHLELNLPNGIYSLKMIMAGHSEIHKLIISK